MLGNVATVSFEFFADDGAFPNSRLPVALYLGAIDAADASPEALEAMFDANGWPSQWRAGVFDYDHYHSTAHECLGIAAGSARLQLGGPNGRPFEVGRGDVIVLPAGTAHRRIDASADFLVVGAYPPGQDWDILKGEAGERPDADRRIAEVAMPVTDPVGGQSGPLLEQWRTASSSQT